MNWERAEVIRHRYELRSILANSGSGIYGPGYEERRKQRIKERYGIDIQPPYYEGESASGA
jgi:hypothetical protein